MIRKLTATGVVAAAAAGFMLLGGAAQAEQHSAGQTNHRPTAYSAHHSGWTPRRHRHHWHGWGWWRHRNHRGHHFHVQH
ncbi:hypothetical protein GCM10023195_44540 [Actinoallomurus liliacearum]|uniref:Uncharacterized protein n=1 Tax=Actinoallomurus liliacearum TaxID=1080073 RepID=A0ABP8TKR3_9ACTN